MKSLASFAVGSPVKVSMIFVGVLLLGWISLTRLPTNLFPDIRAPRLTVTVTTRGLSPAEVERRIAETLERSLYSVRGVTTVQSFARADSAVVVVTFTWETALEYAFLEVKKSASDLQRERSDEIEAVSVLRYDPNSRPVVQVALTAPEGTDEEQVLRTARQTLKPRFERLEGIANVALSGGMEREVVIDLDEANLLSYGVKAEDAINALRSDNVDATGGWVEEGARRYLLKAKGEFRDLTDIAQVVVGRRNDNSIVLADVARVYYAPKEARSLVSFDGKPAVGMAFFREAESNTVAVARDVREELKEAQKILPRDWKLSVADDQSLFISSAINEVRSNAIIGGLLAIAILLLFLRDFRSTMIIGIAIPVSIVATFNLMYFQGVSLNLMSLGGLALGTGMLVDNAIVVLENIFRLRQTGLSPRDAAREGTSEVAGALVASTLTTVAVFLPIVYVKGVAALLFREQALTVTYSLLASLLVALLLIPMLATFFLSGGGDAPAPTFVSTRRGVYARLLGLALRLRLLVLLGAAALLWLTVMGARNIAQEFMPQTNVRQLDLRVVLPSGTPIAATQDLVRTVESAMAPWRPAIERVYTVVGEQEGIVNANTEDPDGPNTADIMMLLRDGDKPTTEMLAANLQGFNSQRLIASLKPTLDRMPDARFEFRAEQGSLMDLLGTSQAPLLIEIAGPELETITALAEQARMRLEQVPTLLNVRTNILDGAPEVLLRLDREQLARLGLDVNQVANILRRRVEGEVATQIREEAGDVDLRVQVNYGTESLDTLRNMLFDSPTGARVRLGAIADFEIQRAPREIVRRSQQRIAFVMADLSRGVKLSSGIADAQASLDGLRIPPRYSVRYTGEEEQRRDAFGDLAFALILSIALVYMVMASIFESFLQPFLIMITIPLAGCGVVASLILTGQTFNVMSIIGIVMLGGIVVNNAIVLLDCVNNVRSAPDAANDTQDERTFLRETLILGCQRRFRPVLMTTATTLLGLLPMALGLGEGAELRQAMAITVLGGLASSTILTLFVIPCCQSYLDSARSFVHRLIARRRAGKPAAT